MINMIFMTDEEIEELGYEWDGTAIIIAGVRYKVIESTSMPSGYYLNEIKERSKK